MVPAPKPAATKAPKAPAAKRAPAKKAVAASAALETMTTTTTTTVTTYYTTTTTAMAASSVAAKAPAKPRAATAPKKTAAKKPTVTKGTVPAIEAAPAAKKAASTAKKAAPAAARKAPEKKPTITKGKMAAIEAAVPLANDATAVPASKKSSTPRTKLAAAKKTEPAPKQAAAERSGGASSGKPPSVATVKAASAASAGKKRASSYARPQPKKEAQEAMPTVAGDGEMAQRQPKMKAELEAVPKAGPKSRYQPLKAQHKSPPAGGGIKISSASDDDEDDEYTGYDVYGDPVRPPLTHPKILAAQAAAAAAGAATSPDPIVVWSRNYYGSDGFHRNYGPGAREIDRKYADTDIAGANNRVRYVMWHNNPWGIDGGDLVRGNTEMSESFSPSGLLSMTFIDGDGGIWEVRAQPESVFERQVDQEDEEGRAVSDHGEERVTKSGGGSAAGASASADFWNQSVF